MVSVGYLCRVAAIAVAGLGLLTACDDGTRTATAGGPAWASSTPTPQEVVGHSLTVGSSPVQTATPTSGTAAPSADTPFCRRAAELMRQADPAAGGTSDTGDAEAFFRQSATAIRSVTAPPALSADWRAVADGLQQLADAYAHTDVDDPAQAAQLEETVTQVETKLGPAENRVNEYLQADCGVAPVGAPASPSR